jgi:cysteinyl-tRNA synthetase
VVKIRDFVNMYGGQVLRHVLLSVHYRARLEWSEEVITRAIEEIKRIHEFVIDVRTWNSDISGEVDNEVNKLFDKFKYELTNDFNSAGAMGHFFSMIRFVKGKKDSITKETLSRVLEVINFVADSLGLVARDPQAVLAKLEELERANINVDVDASWVEGLIEERKVAKASKNWARADEIRKELAAKRVILKDNPDGSTEWKIQ